MQVKKRINRFFGNILRRDKLQELEDEEPPSPKQRRKPKNTQSYSQWDLIDNSFESSLEEDFVQGNTQPNLDTIYSDGLLHRDDEAVQALAMDTVDFKENEDIEKRKSFLKRSGNFLRKSLRRSKKLAKQSEDDDETLKWRGREREIGSLLNVVQEINTTTVEVAQFGYINSPNTENSSTVHVHENPFETNFEGLSEDFGLQKDYRENMEVAQNEDCSESGKKPGLRKGLRRQASLLVSKFHKSPGSIRLKSSVSMESFADGKTSSPDATTPGQNSSELQCRVEKTSSFKRRLSFKAAKKVVSKGASSFGKSMIHASAVMPVSYESPPVSFLPDYVEDCPPHLVQCYYRTISYQPKESQNWNDKLDQGYSSRPTAFYQHGYCYNG